MTASEARKVALTKKEEFFKEYEENISVYVDIETKFILEEVLRLANSRNFKMTMTFANYYAHDVENLVVKGVKKKLKKLGYKFEKEFIKW